LINIRILFLEVTIIWIFPSNKLNWFTVSQKVIHNDEVGAVEGNNDGDDTATGICERALSFKDKPNDIV